jgi:hypothetical protein
MATHYFPAPPTSLSPAEREHWLLRVQEAEKIGGIMEAGLPLVSSETLAFLQRYVRGELSLAQVVRLQAQRLPVR